MGKKKAKSRGGKAGAGGGSSGSASAAAGGSSAGGAAPERALGVTLHAGTPEAWAAVSDGEAGAGLDRGFVGTSGVHPFPCVLPAVPSRAARCRSLCIATAAALAAGCPADFEGELGSAAEAVLSVVSAKWGGGRMRLALTLHTALAPDLLSAAAPPSSWPWHPEKKGNGCTTVAPCP